VDTTSRGSSRYSSSSRYIHSVRSRLRSFNLGRPLPRFFNGTTGSLSLLFFGWAVTTGANGTIGIDVMVERLRSGLEGMDISSSSSTGGRAAVLL
jgi:hypothetical protein